MVGHPDKSKNAGIEERHVLQVQAVHLTPEPFSVENGMLTPSFKLKRPQAKEAFAADIEAMYRRLDARG
jgi:long-subunit acyl-CoA synthetase (AMP-forming)